MVIKQTIVLLAAAVVTGLVANLLSPQRIDFIGKYRDLSDGEGPLVPPAAEEGDPPFIDVNVAQLEFYAGDALFVDARSAEEFECGTIPGSINIPFEYLPEDLPAYYDSVFEGVSRDRSIVVFCSGEECDLSLYLGRNLQDFNYTRVFIFFGGAREWGKYGLDVERRKPCGQ
ncbi:MAG TPA: rhodanese-like domain-containing protein [Acidobacteriota bacterium]|nr:rhodanese-like domain-containing protein [Acidobacteriota bacterium]